MALGNSSTFNILQRSPLDHSRSVEPEPRPAAVEAQEPEKWIPSRFNIQTTTEAGEMILWNTYKGSMSVFTPEQRPAVRSLLTRKGIEAESQGLVAYLVKRGFLIKENSDEYRRFQLAFGRHHYRSDSLNLTLLSSEDCNFRCRYCYEDFARGTMQPWVREAIKKLIEQKLPELRQLLISWFGGEPLYGFEAIEELAPFFLEKAKEHSVPLFSHMTTNGYLLTPDVAEKLLSWRITGFQITIDGTPANHDYNRPTRDGRRTFSTIFGNLQALHQRDEEFSVDIRVNVDKRNYPQIGEFLDSVAEEFAGDSRFKMRFRPVGRWGGANDDDLEVWKGAESTEAMNCLEEAARQRGLHSCDDLRYNNRFGSQVCYAARPNNYVIGTSGKVMKCTVALDMNDADNHNVVGMITPEGELDLDLDKLALWTEPSYETDKKCQRCPILPHCQGISCPLQRILHGASPCVPLRKNAKTYLLHAYKSRKDDSSERTASIGSGR